MGYRLSEKEKCNIIRLADAALHLHHNATEGEWEVEDGSILSVLKNGDFKMVMHDRGASPSDMDLMANSKQMVYKMAGTIHRLLKIIDRMESKLWQRRKN